MRSGFLFFSAVVLLGLCALTTAAQNSSDTPVIVQPGAPGKATRVLPANTTAVAPPLSAKDVEFMQGMIMHHAQAVEMSDLIASRSTHPEVIKFGVRISQSQSDEIGFMKRWLTARGKPLEMKMEMKMDSMQMGDMQMDMMSHDHHMSMPGMLSPEQMKALRASRGEEFDRLFLAGMIQHHKGALQMVKDLFAQPGSGQDAELFNFASDVDSGQRAEIDAMQRILDKMPQGKPTEAHHNH